MRILMLGWELPPDNSGGLGVACFYIAEALASLGESIDFVLPAASPSHNAIDFMDVFAVAPGVSSDTGTSAGAYDHDGLRHMRALQKSYGEYVLQHISEHPVDVIHAHDWLTLEAGLAASQQSGVPLVAHVHATEFDRSGGGRGNPLIHEIEQTGLMMADRILAVSSFTKETLIREYDIPADKIEVAHNGIKLPVASVPFQSPPRWDYIESMRDDGYTIVLVLGRLTVQKGYTHFLRAAALASQLHEKLLFVIAGDGEQRDELIGLSADYGIADKVLFTDFVRGAVWRKLYHTADIFVMSSVSEPFGLTALEAAAHHTALIISRQAGVAEIIRNALRYDYWDAQTLADHMINIALSSSLSSSLRDEAYDEYAGMSWDSVARHCLRAYHTARIAA